MVAVDVRPGQTSFKDLLGMVLMVLVLSMSTSQAVVLCVGCDGHIAFETAGHEHGDHTPSHDGHPAVHQRVPVQHCRSCIDIPVTGGPLHTGVTDGRWQTTGVTAAPAPLSRAKTHRPLAGQPAWPPHSSPPGADPLGSIVLQI